MWVGFYVWKNIIFYILSLDDDAKENVEHYNYALFKCLRYNSFESYFQELDKYVGSSAQGKFIIAIYSFC